MSDIGIPFFKFIAQVHPNLFFSSVFIEQTKFFLILHMNRSADFPHLIDPVIYSFHRSLIMYFRIRRIHAKQVLPSIYTIHQHDY